MFNEPDSDLSNCKHEFFELLFSSYHYKRRQQLFVWMFSLKSVSCNIYFLASNCSNFKVLKICLIINEGLLLVFSLQLQTRVDNSYWFRVFIYKLITCNIFFCLNLFKFFSFENPNLLYHQWEFIPCFQVTTAHKRRQQLLV